MLLFAHIGLALASARLNGRLDLIFLAIGSMLPDIIDKPLGLLLFGSPSMGRTFAHTLLFLSILAATAFYFRDAKIASLSWGVLVHLLLDSMWHSPVTLLWPLLGGFPVAPHMDTVSYLQMLLMGLESADILIPELVGFAYLIGQAYYSRGAILANIKRLPGKQKDIHGQSSGKASRQI